MRYAYRFILQIIFTIALVFITIHGQAIWLNIPRHGLWGAILVELEIAAPIIIGAIIVIVLIGVMSVKDQRRLDRESRENIQLHKDMNKTLKSILSKLGGNIDDAGDDSKSE